MIRTHSGLALLRQRINDTGFTSPLLAELCGMTDVRLIEGLRSEKSIELPEREKVLPLLWVLGLTWDEVSASSPPSGVALS